MSCMESISGLGMQSVLDSESILDQWRSSEELGGFVNAEQAGSKRPIGCCPCRFGVCWNPTCIWMSWGESGQPTCPTVSGGDCIDGIAVIPS